MPFTPALVAAINAAYRAFAGVPRPTSLEASPLRDAKAILRTLTAAPLRALSDEQIGPYSGWAITTVGSARDYRHFLPRILELSVTDTAWNGATPPLIASRLIMGDWRRWPDDEQGAVEAVFRTAFDWSVDASVDRWVSPESWLCGLASLELPVEASLARWRASQSIGAAIRLGEMARSWDGDVDDEENIVPPFWEDIPLPIVQRVHRWIFSRETVEQLRVALPEIAENWQWEVESAMEAVVKRC